MPKFEKSEKSQKIPMTNTLNKKNKNKRKNKILSPIKIYHDQIKVQFENNTNTASIGSNQNFNNKNKKKVFVDNSNLVINKQVERRVISESAKISPQKSSQNNLRYIIIDGSNVAME